MTKSEIRKIKKGIELIKLLLDELRPGSIIKRRDSFFHIFYNGDRLDELFLAIIPVEKIEEITRTLLQVKTSSGCIGDEYTSMYGNIKIGQLRKILDEFLGYLNDTLTKFGFTVFYSWQTDTISAFNRNFIEDSLEKAVKKACERSNLPFLLDKDTANREGSPDIARTILEKIDDCLLFVADISITGKIETESKTPRLQPNSNVLYELGYAHGVLGDSNIIMIFNEATGDIEKLPFDLKGRRIMRYRLGSDTSPEEKSKEKEKLISHLSNAIISVADVRT